MEAQRGLFISFEGSEGVGKTTLMDALATRLQAQGYSVVRTREPGGTPLAERLRAQLLEAGNEPIAPDCELLLMFAARSQHLSQRILPALAAGQVVLCDRFVDSSYAYQCSGRGLARHKLDLLVQQFVPRLPDLTFWLDVPLALARQRVEARSQATAKGLDRFEQEQQQFFERVRDGFAEQARREPDRVVRLDATAAAMHVADAAWALLSSRRAGVAGAPLRPD